MKFPKGKPSYYEGSECLECGEYMKDVTPFKGWGNPKTPPQHRSKSFYDRGKSQKIHQ